MTLLKPHEYQYDAIDYCLLHSRSYQALDMGLGKTCIALKWAAHILKKPETKGVLVIAPLRPVYTTWPEEVEKWTPHLTYTILHGLNKLSNLNANTDLYFMNYEGIPWLFEALQKYFKLLKKMPFRAIIIDEASMLKSPRTKRFKTIKKLIKIFPKWRMMLSATPAPKSYMDLWSQYFLLDDGKRLGTSFARFQMTYFYPADRNGFYWFPKDGAEQVILDLVKDITYRLPADGYVKMPERIDNIIKLQLPKKVVKLYTELEKKFFLEFENSKVEIFSKASLSMKLRQIIQGAIYTDDKGNYETLHTVKVDALKELMETSAGQPILCAIQFRFELDMITKAFPGTPYIAKGISSKEAQHLIQKWNKGEIPLLLCHPLSLSHGVNLQTGGHIILWYGLTWSPEQYIQLTGRLERQGQINPFVIVHHFIMSNTIDTAVISSQKARGLNQQKMLSYLNEYRLRKKEVQNEL